MARLRRPILAADSLALLTVRIDAHRVWRSVVNHTYKTIELVGSSPNGTDEAVRNAIAKASETVRNLRWFEVIETRGQIEGGKVAHWQATVKIGFTLE